MPRKEEGRDGDHPTTKRTEINKAAYVRGLPATLSVKEVLARAKADGITLGASSVYKVRSGPAKKTGTKQGRSKATAPATAPDPGLGHGSKSAFVRRLPKSVPAKEVVERAKAEGIKLSVAQVYNIRSTAKLKRTANKAGKPAGLSIARVSTLGGESEARLRKIIAELGLQRSREVLAEVRAAFGG